MTADTRGRPPCPERVNGNQDSSWGGFTKKRNMTTTRSTAALYWLVKVGTIFFAFPEKEDR
jgi:hypothetical protein